ncbi:MAG: hypothetical protein IMF05_02010 [Proteobacteria bacterium]|nr:hypothetical protein [Pseudomonadota bacterium]
MRLALALLFILAATTATIVTASNPATASEAAGLAKRVIAAYGGARTIEQGGSFKQSGTLESYRHGKTGTVERRFTRPGRLRIEIRIPGEPPESRILDGEKGWRDGKPVPPMMAKAMYLQAARLDLPWLIMQAGQNLQMLGPVKHDDGRDLEALEIPMAEGIRLIAVVDPETGHIVRSHGLIILAPGQEVEFGTLYEGHGDLNGMILDTEETHFARGQPTGKTTLESSEVVEGFPDGVFRP